MIIIGGTNYIDLCYILDWCYIHNFRHYFTCTRSKYVFPVYKYYHIRLWFKTQNTLVSANQTTASTDSLRLPLKHLIDKMLKILAVSWRNRWIRSSKITKNIKQVLHNYYTVLLPYYLNHKISHIASFKLHKRIPPIKTCGHTLLLHTYIQPGLNMH